MHDELVEFPGNAKDRQEKASQPILRALENAKEAFKDWEASCHFIDSVYSRGGQGYENLLSAAGGSTWRDGEMDLFWSSFEILKPAVYARPPVPVVSPMFKDGGRLKDTTAELLERSTISTFNAVAVDDVLRAVRDDLIFSGRGVVWMRYEDDGGKRVAIEHLEREDFLHEPARRWCDVGWVAGGF